ncbi:MAG: hypothetical protein RIR96_516, partial [Bacteroidota bacterium]
MCGIAGVIGKGTNVKLPLMIEKIRHRGPDGVGIWENESISLGHVRLSIIDLSSNADQPMIDEETGNVLVFNGEIYNYLELKKTIGNRYSFKTDSDTEVILALYRIYGEDMLQYLRGMFAFALYDSKNDIIFLARDRFGIKPLYYRSSNGSILFASEIKALVNHNDLSDEINELKSIEFLANCKLDTDHQTLFKDVFQILPSHYAMISGSGKMIKKQSYWNFPEPGKRIFDKKSEEELYHQFSESISLHLRSDVPVGTFLSGGLDSTTVTSFVRKLSAQPILHSFSALLPYDHPENALIPKYLSIQKEVVNHGFLLDGNEYFNDISDIIYHHDEPVMDGSMYAHYKLCQLAAQNNIKVILSGSGGDELFGGYGSYIYASHAALLKKGKIKSYFREIIGNAGVSGETVANLIMKSTYELFPEDFKQKMKNFRLRNQVKHLHFNEEITHYFHRHSDIYLSNMINNYRSWTAPPFLHYEDRNSMAFGVEARVPFFDHKLVEFVLQFDHSDIMRGRTKNLMRKSFRGTVPDFILDQKGKYGFPSPINHRLKTDDAGKSIFFDLVEKTPLLQQKAA